MGEGKQKQEHINHDENPKKILEKYFVHISGLLDDVKEGNLVTYDLEKGAKGMNAVNVKKI